MTLTQTDRLLMVCLWLLTTILIGERSDLAWWVCVGMALFWYGDWMVRQLLTEWRARQS